ncbi:hypothetical protein [Lusitaniella coriacea]|uniref:hypothetical protein n=1 Tax=Lusitaniella coriacea TaxID=1983105 RepID=UPI003CF94429
MSITQKKVIKYLLDLTSRHKLVEQAMASCDDWFANDGGEIDGWIAQDLEKQFFSHQLIFQRSDWDSIYIDTCLKLLASNGREIGHYRLISTLDGEIDDDYLVLELSKDDWENDRVVTVCVT